MFMASIARVLSSMRRRTCRVGRRSLRPQVEPLESRALPSTVVALTGGNTLLSFDSASPGRIVRTTSVTGLGAGETLLGIDMRPATGELFGLDSGARLYVIDPVGGAAALRFNLGVTLVGNRFGVDFNPVVDRLRVVSDLGQNLRINPNNGQVVTDSALKFANGDVNAAAQPAIVELAYTNNQAGASTTTLFGADPNLHALVTVGGPDGAPSPNSGQLFTAGRLGKAGITPTGLDIAPSGSIFVSHVVAFPSGAKHVINQIDAAGNILLSLGRIGSGDTPIDDIAVLPSVQLSAALYSVREGQPRVTITVTRSEGGVGTFTVGFATRGGSARSGRDFRATSGTLTFAPGETSKTFSVRIIDDRLGERDELFSVFLHSPTGGAILGNPPAARVRISTNDRPDLAGPRVTHFGLTGPSTAITGAAVHFNEDLNRGRASDRRNYELFGLAGGRRRRIVFASADYDEATRTVNLAVPRAFRQTRFQRFEFFVNGQRGGLTDAQGNLLDGDENGRPGGDAELVFRVFTSPRSVTITDRDGDRGTLRINVAQSIDGIEPIRAPRGQRTQFWLVNVVPLDSRLTGRVQKGLRGDGIIVVAEIIGLDKKEFNPSLLPGFVFRNLTFTSNATGA